jgi:hypothetical protein
MQKLSGSSWKKPTAEEIREYYEQTITRAVNWWSDNARPGQIYRPNFERQAIEDTATDLVIDIDDVIKAVFPREDREGYDAHLL